MLSQVWARSFFNRPRPCPRTRPRKTEVRKTQFDNASQRIRIYEIECDVRFFIRPRRRRRGRVRGRLK
jgi:hypothetical protein